MTQYRKEYDSMGEVLTPSDAYYGAQTQRAVDNFSISGLRFPQSFYYALGLIKKNAAIVNRELGLLPEDTSRAIEQAAEEMILGKLDEHFVLDVFQTGSGTSTNMNVNEVLAGRANEILTGKRGGKAPVHPNDHVNKGQSSNDVIPTAIHVAALVEIRRSLIPHMERLASSLEQKASEFADVKKIGRTHMQDAVPITLGDEFGAWARQMRLSIHRIKNTEGTLRELALGGTAVGSGLNADPRFAGGVIRRISAETNIAFKEAENHFEAQAAQDAAVEVSGALKSLAVSLTKIAADIRLLSSGPRCGIGEINIPALQPGSSIMPGKVNPVIPEMTIQAAAQVLGSDVTIAICGQWGILELNVMLPVIAYNLLFSIKLLSGACNRFAYKCVDGITANVEKCCSGIERSLAMSTALVPEIGYEQAALLSKKAYESGKTVREVAREDKTLPESRLNELLDQTIHR